MNSKECFKCHQTLPLSEFYAHPQMADGHLNKCKGCARCDATEHRRDDMRAKQEYDNRRASLPHRRQLALDGQRRRRTQCPEKILARQSAERALRTGAITKRPCWFCGKLDNVEMHHPDYSQPLLVYWLCRQCHRRHDSLVAIAIKATLSEPALAAPGQTHDTH